MVVPLIVPPINDVAHDVAKHPIGLHAIVEPKIVVPLIVPENIAAPVDVKEPLIPTLPVNSCVLADIVPKWVEPVTKSTLEVIVWTTNVCAVSVPGVVIEPVTTNEPLTTWLPTKLLEPVVA